MSHRNENDDNALNPVPDGSTDAASTDENTAMNDNTENGFLIVGIGASAGGLEAFQTFLRNMRDDSGMAFVLISHLAPNHESLLSELLDKETEMSVVQAENEMRVQPNHVYVIPPNTTLTLKQRTLQLKPPKEARGHRTPIDLFFTSLAEDQKENAVCIILSGTGSDGTIGLKAVKENGGLAIAQDSDTAKYDGMPRNAVLTGLIDYVLPVEEMPAKLLEDVRHFRDLKENVGLDSIVNETTDKLDQICSILHSKLGHDFSNYKPNTLVRRIQRRIRITHATSASEYIKLLGNSEEEVKSLFQDLLIGVTQFFRDPEAFEALKENVIKPLAEKCTSERPIRIWVAGCSSGEEAYSIAILLHEVMGFRDLRSSVKLFATDIDGRSLALARQGRYPEGIAEHITQNRLNLYFTKQDNSYQINKTIRETCIFSQHSLISDPPFSRIDLVACRNVLIYFDTDLKNNLVPLFHYALSPEGYLFLGPSENLNHRSELFHPIDKQYRIFQRKEVMVSPKVNFSLGSRDQLRSLGLTGQPPEKKRQQRIQEVIEQVLLQEYSPPCVIVNEQREVVYFFGSTGKYLEPSQGVPSNNIFDLARRGLRLDLRTAIKEAFKNRKTVIRKKVAIENDDRIQLVTLIVRPVKDKDQYDGLMMVIFKDEQTRLINRESSGESRVNSQDDRPLVQELEVELQKTKEHLRTTIEELENSNEELKSANEELLSMNEELQSSNEELQTSKEEMQSINEELETVNAELRSKVEELHELNSDVQNFLESTQIATIFLDRQLRIKQFTPVATDLFNFIQTDVNRPITDIALSLDSTDLARDIHEVLRTLIPLEKQVKMSSSNRHYKMRIMPYRTVENVIDGAVMTFVDITDLRQARNKAERRAQQQTAIAEIGLYAIQNTDFHAICDRVIEIICKTLPSDFCSLFQCQGDGAQPGGQLLLTVGRNWPEDLIGNGTVEVNNSQVGYTLSQNNALVVEDGDTENRFPLLPILRDRGIEVKSGLSATIHGLEGPYGVLAVHNRQARQYTSDDASFLQAIANTISAACQRHQRTEALTQSSSRLDLAIDAGQMGIWEYDVATDLSTWNEIEYELFGLNPEEVGRPSGDLFFQYVHPEDAERVKQNFESQIARKEEFIDEFRVVLPDEQLRWIAARGRVICDEQGNPVKVIGVNYDISDRKQSEEALKEADRRKDRFLAALGHELRNPLNALYHSLALLKQATDRDRLDRIREIMERQARLLTGLIDDLLDASRLAYDKIQLDYEPVNLVLILQEVREDCRTDITQKNIQCNLQLPDDEVWVNGDRTRLAQAFTNVLYNAIKFSNEGDGIEITLECTEQKVTVAIADSGIGMTPEALDRIFIPFSQEENSRKQSGGLGLGLALTRGLIEMHQGQIWATSEGLEQGSQIHIELPRMSDPDSVSESEDDSPQTPDAATTPTSSRILVIEDNLDSALLIQLLLESLGYEIEMADSAEAGIAQARSFKPDLVISDIGLPGEMDGYDVARTLRNDEELRSVYLIAMSGYGQQEDKAQAQEAGFDVHITKPVNIEEIRQLIQAQMSN